MFHNIDYLIYSSHKTSTQSLSSIFEKNGISHNFLHNMSNICVIYPEYDIFKNIGYGNRMGWGQMKNSFYLKKIILDNLIKYKNSNNKKLNVISIVRNPKERLLSSLFQTYHCDEKSYQNKDETDTTIYKLNEEQIYNLYHNEIVNNTLPGGIEALDELSSIFDIDVISQLQPKEDYYYFENDLIKLYVLKFKHVINENNLTYLNKSLGINVTINSQCNLTENKSYYQKYNIVKNMINDNINNIIYNRYNKFYFL